ncbi:site-specific integrase [Actinosynnema pretiosum subsp. pretiosum]|uniref:Site-specific integrase n=1 Tax=Actinosynnema pretiosum subsp. pretiosum TaxID=103721 RepID=A0AA45R660_9PSEU|nr:Integrase [Actinosynnema pretiosum subsp. pretiosum]QUF06363.1 site-specific integrase [Actinosynnema pretiosum subsp. pretiosum]
MTKRRKPKRPEGSIYQRGRKWAFSFDGPPHPLTGERQKIRQSGFASFEEAEEAMAEARAAVKAETYVKPTRATVAAFFEAWFPYVRTTTEATTANNYATMAHAYVLPWIGKRPIKEITPSVLAALYEHLLTQGRRKRDTNWEMYQVWLDAQVAKREIRPREIADKVGVSYHAARKAVQRYLAGRVPEQTSPGLSAKTVASVHIMLGSAFTTAVAWKYVSTNPTNHVKAPTVPRRSHATWSPQEMTRFLEAARGDRFYALWVLAASTGMRRSELCGLRTSALDLAAATVRMTATRVVAGGKATDGSGKSARSRRLLSLDRFTTQVLRVHLGQVERDKADWGTGYRDAGRVFCWEDGSPFHPDTVTERFNRLVDAAKVPRIRLHDVRHSYATIALRSGVHPKIVSSRLGHATVAFTLDTYSADVPDLDRQAAEDIGGLFLPPAEDEES